MKGKDYAVASAVVPILFECAGGQCPGLGFIDGLCASARNVILIMPLRLYIRCRKNCHLKAQNHFITRGFAIKIA